MNFDLSKIYSEQVNKQKIYLNPYVTQTNIIEEAKVKLDPKAAALVKHIMILAFTNKDVASTDISAGPERALFTYEGASDKYRIGKNYEISLQEFKDLLLKVPKLSPNLIKSINIIADLPMGKPFKLPNPAANEPGKSGSSQYESVVFEITYTKGKWDKDTLDQFDNLETLSSAGDTEIEITSTTSLMPAGKNETSFSTPVKENLPGIVFNLSVETPSLLGDMSKPKDSSATDPAGIFLEKMTDILAQGVQFFGIPKAAVDRTYFALEAFRGLFARTAKKKADGSLTAARVDGIRRKMLIGTTSIPRKLLEMNFNPDEFYYIGGPDDGGVHSLIKSKGSQLSGLKEDEWCPADIFIASKKEFPTLEELQKHILKEIADAEKGASADSAQDLALNKYNSLFCPSFTPEAVGGDTPLLAVSLKQEKSQAGKAKNWLRSYMKDICETNFTAEERTQWSNETCVEKLNELCNNVLDWCNRPENKDKIIIDGLDAIDNRGKDFWRNIYYAQLPDKDLCALHPKFKYGAVKILHCAMQSGDTGIFQQTLLAGRKINGEDVDSVPPFFKLQENSNGLADLTREDGRIVEVNTPYTIKHLFSTSNTGIEIFMGTSELEKGASAPYNANWKIKLVKQGKDAVEVETSKA